MQNEERMGNTALSLGSHVDVLSSGKSSAQSHLDFVQVPHDVLAVWVLVVQALFQLLHLLLESLQSRLHLRPFGVAHLAQQSLGAGLVVVQDAGEDAHVDVQGDVHQLHVFSLRGEEGNA